LSGACATDRRRLLGGNRGAHKAQGLTGPFLSAVTLIGFAALSNRFFWHRFHMDY